MNQQPEAPEEAWAALISSAGHNGYTAHIQRDSTGYRAILAWFTGAGKGLGDVAYMEFREATAEEARRRCLEGAAGDGSERGRDVS